MLISTLAITAIVLLGVLIARHSPLLSMDSGGVIASSVVLGLDGLAITALLFTSVFLRKTEQNKPSIVFIASTPRDVYQLFKQSGENLMIYVRNAKKLILKNKKGSLISYPVFEGDPSVNRAMYGNESHMVVEFKSKLYHVYYLKGEAKYASLLESEKLAWMKDEFGTYLQYCPPIASMK